MSLQYCTLSSNTMSSQTLPLSSWTRKALKFVQLISSSATGAKKYTNQKCWPSVQMVESAYDLTEVEALIKLVKEGRTSSECKQLTKQLSTIATRMRFSILHFSSIWNSISKVFSHWNSWIRKLLHNLKLTKCTKTFFLLDKGKQKIREKWFE